MPDWELIVVGDKKTPHNFKLERAIYVTPEDQEKIDKDLSDAIGWNCIQRRNFGLLVAYKKGADIVATVDDDNIPYENWGKDLYIGKNPIVDFYESEIPVFDPIGATNEKHLWHRGYPLQLIQKRDYSKKTSRKVPCDIQADFWNGDPDIDAICRMIYKPESRFDESYFPLSSNVMGPFNSQNTFLSRHCIKDYFLFPHIGRMDDIWASYFIQAKGRKVVYNRPTVYQARNIHNLINDMKMEYMGYEKNLELTERLLHDPNDIKNFLPAISWEAFKLYQRHFE